MPSTFSPSLRIELIGSGEQSGVWGTTTNNNLGDLIEQAISGATALDVSASDITLTALNGVTDQSRSAVLSVTGNPGTTRTLTIPNVNKAYTVKNRSDSTVNIKTSTGVAYAVPTLSEAYIYCDGNNVITGRTITDGANTFTSNTAPLNNTALTGVPTAPTAAPGTNTTQIATTAFATAALQAVFPVGSVYINAAVTTNPASLFGFGTWVAIGAGRVLVGQDTGDSVFDTLGETGGSKDAIVVAHTHTGSGTTGSTSIDHTHSFSATTDNVNLSHSHTGGTNTPSLTGDFWVGGGNNGTSGIVSRVATGGRPGLDAASGFQELYRVNASHSHTLTINNALGEHAHSVSGTTGTAGGSHTHSFSLTTASTGSSGTNANLQPYLVVKMWQRTA